MNTIETLEKLEETIIAAQYAIEDAQKQIQYLKEKQPQVTVGSIFTNKNNDCVYTLIARKHQIVFVNITNHSEYARTLPRYDFEDKDSKEIKIPFHDFNHMVRGQGANLRVINIASAKRNRIE